MSAVVNAVECSEPRGILGVLYQLPVQVLCTVRSPHWYSLSQINLHSLDLLPDLLPGALVCSSHRNLLRATCCHTQRSPMLFCSAVR